MAWITRRKFLKLSGAAIAVSVAMPSVLLASPFQVPVLMYHDIADETDEYTLSPSLFAAQMEWLYSNGVKAVFPADLSSLDTDAGRTVIITFDDGFASFADYAFPLLREYGFKSVMNIVSSLMGTSLENGWRKPILSWEEARELDSTGLVEFGCHTHNLHSIARNASTVSAGELKDDMDRFIRVYEKELGKSPVTLAWPYGLYNQRTVEAARKAGFRFLFNSKPGYLQAGGPYDGIPRTNIDNGYGMALFGRLVKGTS